MRSSGWMAGAAARARRVRQPRSGRRPTARPQVRAAPNLDPTRAEPSGRATGKSGRGGTTSEGGWDVASSGWAESNSAGGLFSRSLASSSRANSGLDKPGLELAGRTGVLPAKPGLRPPAPGAQGRPWPAAGGLPRIAPLVVPSGGWGGKPATIRLLPFNPRAGLRPFPPADPLPEFTADVPPPRQPGPQSAALLRRSVPGAFPTEYRDPNRATLVVNMAKGRTEELTPPSAERSTRRSFRRSQTNWRAPRQHRASWTDAAPGRWRFAPMDCRD